MARRHSDHPQLPLFPGCLDLDVDLRRLIKDIIEKCPHSREVIAAKMSELTASKITKAMLDAWTAPSRGAWAMPVKHIAAFSTATESPRLLEYIAGKHGGVVLTGRDRVDVDLGRIDRKIEDLRLQRVELLREGRR